MKKQCYITVELTAEISSNVDIENSTSNPHIIDRPLSAADSTSNFRRGFRVEFLTGVDVGGIPRHVSHIRPVLDPTVNELQQHVSERHTQGQRYPTRDRHPPAYLNDYVTS